VSFSAILALFCHDNLRVKGYLTPMATQECLKVTMRLCSSDDAAQTGAELMMANSGSSLILRAGDHAPACLHRDLA
jgi:hypothetical protein